MLAESRRKKFGDGEPDSGQHIGDRAAGETMKQNAAVICLTDGESLRLAVMSRASCPPSIGAGLAYALQARQEYICGHGGAQAAGETLRAATSSLTSCRISYSDLPAMIAELIAAISDSGHADDLGVNFIGGVSSPAFAFA